MLDRFPLAPACIACHLHLLEDARCKHVFLDLHTMSITNMASIHLSISTSTSLALLSNHLILQLELGGMAIVEILQRNAHTNFHIRTSSLTTSMSEMSSATEEPRE